MHCALYPAGQFEQAVLALGGAVVIHQVGGGAAEQDGSPGQAAQGQGRVAGVVGGQRDRLRLFVRTIVGFVQDDEAQARDRRKKGGAGADDDVGLAAAHPLPGGVALAQAELAVEQDHPARKAGLEAADRLGRQADFGDQDDGPPPGVQRFGQQPQIDFGLARSGDAVQQDDAGAVQRAGAEQPLLIGRQRRPRLGGLGVGPFVFVGVEADQPPRRQLPQGGQVGAGLGVEAADPDAVGAAAQRLQHGAMLFRAAQLDHPVEDLLRRQGEEHDRLLPDAAQQPFALQRSDDRRGDAGSGFEFVHRQDAPLLAQEGEGGGLFGRAAQVGLRRPRQGDGQRLLFADLHPTPLGQGADGSLAAIGQGAQLGQGEGRVGAAGQDQQGVGLFGGAAQAGQRGLQGRFIGQQADELDAGRRGPGRDQGVAGVHQAPLGQGVDHGLRLLAADLGQQRAQAQPPPAPAQQLQSGSLGGRKVGGRRGVPGLGDDDKGALFQAGRQHQAQRLIQRGQVFVGDPAGQGDLGRGDDGARVEEFGHVADFDLRRQVGGRGVAPGDDDAQGRAAPKGNLNQVADSGGFAQARRQAVGVGRQARAVAPQRLGAGRRAAVGWAVDDDFDKHRK